MGVSRQVITLVFGNASASLGLYLVARSVSVSSTRCHTQSESILRPPSDVTAQCVRVVLLVLGCSVESKLSVWRCVRSYEPPLICRRQSVVSAVQPGATRLAQRCGWRLVSGK